MDKVCFLNSENEEEQVIVNCRIFKESNNVIKIIFQDIVPSDDILLSGFNIVNEFDNVNMTGNYYHNYNTIFKKIDEYTIMLSNDGSIYVNPAITEISEVKPYEPTEEELQAIFENKRKNKVNESKILLASYLETHPITSDCHGGVESKYNVTSEKQTLMASKYLTYTIAKQSGVENPTLTWNATGCECEEWTEEEFITLVLQISTYVKPFVSLQQSYEVAINACTTQEELDAIEIVYDINGSTE